MEIQDKHGTRSFRGGGRRVGRGASLKENQGSPVCSPIHKKVSSRIYFKVLSGVGKHKRGMGKGKGVQPVGAKM